MAIAVAGRGRICCNGGVVIGGGNYKPIPFIILKMNLRNPLLSALAGALAALFLSVIPSLAAPPDLTAGGVPDPSNNRTFNLGPTGMRGWAYYVQPQTLVRVGRSWSPMWSRGHRLTDFLM